MFIMLMFLIVDPDAEGAFLTLWSTCFAADGEDENLFFGIQKGGHSKIPSVLYRLLLL
jgi:hypothetical protein